MARLEGKVAIVTGGARGIGRHFATALAAEGARVMIGDIVDAQEAVDEIAGKHGKDAAASMVFDVGDEAQIKALVAKTVERFGQIDILVNNAAVYATLKPRDALEWDAETWDKVLTVNVRGPYLMTRHVAPHMIARKSGKIINIGSAGAYRGIPRMLPYATSKGAVLAFTRALSRELGGHGINVNTLSPGYTLSDTGLANTAHVEEERMRMRSTRAFKRDAFPEDLTGALIFLCSSESDWVTGQSLVVDGGSVNN